GAAGSAGQRAQARRAQDRPGEGRELGPPQARGTILMTPIPLDHAVAELLLRYAKLVVARGYVHNSLRLPGARRRGMDVPSRGERHLSVARRHDATGQAAIGWPEPRTRRGR